MSNVLDRTAEGQALLARGEARGRADGMGVLLAAKFGESDALAGIAVGLAGHGFAEGLRRIHDAATLLPATVVVGAARRGIVATCPSSPYLSMRREAASGSWCVIKNHQRRERPRPECPSHPGGASC